MACRDRTLHTCVGLPISSFASRNVLPYRRSCSAPVADLYDTPCPCAQASLWYASICRGTALSNRSGGLKDLTGESVLVRPSPAPLRREGEWRGLPRPSSSLVLRSAAKCSPTASAASVITRAGGNRSNEDAGEMRRRDHPEKTDVLHPAKQSAKSAQRPTCSHRVTSSPATIAKWAHTSGGGRLLYPASETSGETVSLRGNGRRPMVVQGV